MGYDSSIKIKREEIPFVERLLISYGFEKLDEKPDKFAKSIFTKYIDDRCKYFQGVTFTICQSKGFYVCGRNNIGCSSYDLKLHNETLHQLSIDLRRDYFTDEGTNLPFDTGTLTDGYENALWFSFSILHNRFEEIFHFLSCVSPVSEAQRSISEIFKGLSLCNQESFSTNVLTIYLVSTLENYFKLTFVNLLKCLPSVDLNRIETSTNYPRYAIDQFNRGDINIYQKIACGYSFQNIDSIIKTFRNCLNIDLNIVFNKNTFLKRSKRDVFGDLFNRRHGNVHELKYDFLTIEDFIKYCTIVIKTLNEVYHFLCKHYGVGHIEGDLFHTSYKKNIEFIENLKKDNF